ncbi:MAG: DUF2927 domain-containing protein [Verrucomicrobiota bacterium]
MPHPTSLSTLPTLLATLALTLSLGRADSPSPQPDPVVWSQQILRISEFKNTWRPVRRWIFSPSLSAFSNNPNHHALTRDIVATLNQPLANTPIKQIRLLPPNDYRANIKVHFVPLAQFPDIAKSLGMDAPADNFGLFWITRNARNQIIRATVALATDKLEDKALRHFACEEITQSLGLPNDSKLYRDSIFYAGDFKDGDPLTLTHRDTQLIDLLYNHLSPGDSPQKTHTAITNFWRNKN